MRQCDSCYMTKKLPFELEEEGEFGEQFWIIVDDTGAHLDKLLFG